jgi:hypothetical protein
LVIGKKYSELIVIQIDNYEAGKFVVIFVVNKHVAPKAHDVFVAFDVNSGFKVAD